MTRKLIKGRVGTIIELTADGSRRVGFRFGKVVRIDAKRDSAFVEGNPESNPWYVSAEETTGKVFRP